MSQPESELESESESQEQGGALQNPQKEKSQTQRCFAAIYARDIEYLDSLLAEGTHKIDELIDGSNLLHECISCTLFAVLPHFFESPFILSSCKQVDINGMTPLTVALSVGSPYWVVESLLNVYPEALAISDQSGWYPIHYSTRQNPSDVTSMILRRSPAEAQRWLDSNNRRQLPIHLQVGQYKNKTYEGMMDLANAYPGSVDIKDPTTSAYPIDGFMLLVEKRHTLLRLVYLMQKLRTADPAKFEEVNQGVPKLIHSLTFEAPNTVIKNVITFVGTMDSRDNKMDDGEGKEIGYEEYVESEFPFETCGGVTKGNGNSNSISKSKSNDNNNNNNNNNNINNNNNKRQRTK